MIHTPPQKVSKSFFHIFLIIAYSHFSSASTSKKSHVELSDNETEEVLPISTIFFFRSNFNFINNVLQKNLQQPLEVQGTRSDRTHHHLKTLNLRHPPFHSKTKQRMLMCSSIHPRRSVESHEEPAFFASTSNFLLYLPFIYTTICARAKGSVQTIVAESTTLRRHIEANHSVRAYLIISKFPPLDLFFKSKYNAWCIKNNFESKLPKVVKSRKDAKAAEDRSKQSSLDTHLEEQCKETFVPYSDSLFREAAIEWLVATDQVIFYLFISHFKYLTSKCSHYKRLSMHPFIR
jgi:hypothetical protein